MQSGKVGPNGNIIKVDMKKLNQKQILDLLKKNKSLDEQNKYLQKYLQEMVKENENLQQQLNDAKMTLNAAKKSLAEVTENFQK